MSRPRGVWCLQQDAPCAARRPAYVAAATVRASDAKSGKPPLSSLEWTSLPFTVTSKEPPRPVPPETAAPGAAARMARAAASYFASYPHAPQYSITTTGMPPACDGSGGGGGGRGVNGERRARAPRARRGAPSSSRAVPARRCLPRRPWCAGRSRSRYHGRHARAFRRVRWRVAPPPGLSIAHRRLKRYKGDTLT